MIYVCVRSSPLQADYEARKIFWENPKCKELVEKRQHKDGGVEFTLKTGDRLFFCSASVYQKWCFGRTYKLFGSDDLYHSGMVVSE